MFEVLRDIRTMGSVGIQKDPRVVATLKDGKEIIADVATISQGGFRIYLERLLGRDDLTDKSRKQILMALQASDTELAESGVPHKR